MNNIKTTKKSNDTSKKKMDFKQKLQKFKKDSDVQQNLNQEILKKYKQKKKEIQKNCEQLKTSNLQKKNDLKMKLLLIKKSIIIRILGRQQ